VIANEQYKHGTVAMLCAVRKKYKVLLIGIGTELNNA